MIMFAKNRTALSVAVLVFPFAACQSSTPAGRGQEPTPKAPEPAAPIPTMPPASSGAADASMLVVDASPDVAASEASRGQPPPPFATIKKLVLTREQGGPSLRRCSGIVEKITIDLAAGRFVRATCESGNKDDESETKPLTPHAGKLGKEQRATIGDAYAKLTIVPGLGCGKDGGPVTLEVFRAGAAVARYVDMNWTCTKPPPDVAEGLMEFAMTVRSEISR
jgi:hypothetical protein